jgi:RNA polymerase sigma-70 factor (ECF subfamily)
MSTTQDSPRDAELMRQVADGSGEALGELHRRFARSVFRIAAQSLDRAAAEDLVQDVFLAVWRNAGRFDPARGTVRAWILQIAHFRLLNELRRRSRHPQDHPQEDADDSLLDRVASNGAGPAEAASRRRRRDVIEAALGELTPPQREALGLVFVDDLTHEQAAAELGLPLGTAKTRIRAGLQKLRATLAPQAAALVALCLLAALGIHWRSDRATLDRYDRALAMVTASDSVNLRLAPAPETPEATHARYRGRAGAGIAIMTFSSFPPAETGRTYQAWVRHGSVWTSLGTVEPDANGGARLVAEDARLAALPDGVQVTIEPTAGSRTPSGRVVVEWAR